MSIVNCLAKDKLFCLYQLIGSLETASADQLTFQLAHKPRAVVQCLQSSCFVARFSKCENFVNHWEPRHHCSFLDQLNGSVSDVSYLHLGRCCTLSDHIGDALAVEVPNVPGDELS